MQGGRSSSISGGAHSTGESVCVYDSSAYFIRDVVTGREVLIFGDVEPDSISLSPRNLHIWQEAAPKIAAGNLAAIFIECSYDDSQSVDRLFGHLTPRFIAEEMNALAAEVTSARATLLQERELADKTGSVDKKKRKREGDDGLLGKRKPSTQQRPLITSAAGNGVSNQATDDPVSPKTLRPPGRNGSGSFLEDGAGGPGILDTPHVATPTAELSLRDVETSTPATPQSVSALRVPLPLKGLRVVVIHVKEKQNDEEPAGETILAELLEHERDAQLGVEYSVSAEGQSIYL